MLNKINKIIGIILLLLFLVGCGKKESKTVNYNDKRAIKNLAAQLIDKEIQFIASGNFSSERTKSIVAGTEVSVNNRWGISFTLIEKVDDEYKEVYNTGLLEGSFDKCIVDKMKLSSFKGEMIYYNSRDFYLGSGGGDVFLYIINFSKKEIYYAHLIVQKSAGVLLYLSENIEDPMMRKFFIRYFKKDYSTLRIIKSDLL
uniref:Lipoprotein n=1 Tax=uncultured bacterium W5-47b TaxID=1130998 RepID=H9BX48_9BACT|nr:hypothetical protein [uncultured bacterium W5-47b]